MADVLLALAAEDPGGPGLGAVRPAWTSIGFGQDMLAAARAVATDAGASPLVPWSVLRGNGGNLVEFQGTQQAVVEGASRPCVRLWDRWLRLVPEVVLPPPVGGLPDPVPVPVANQRCTLSIGAWERCCGFPIEWETNLRLHLPAVAFELHDLHDRVCPWVPEAPAPAGAGSAEPRPRGLPSSRIERALLTFPQEHAWDVVLAVLPWVAQSLACRGCPDQHVTTQVRLHTQAHTSGTYPPEVWSKHHKLVYGGAQRSADVVAAFEAAVVTESAESAVVVGLYRARCCALLVSPDGAGLDARYTCGACQKWPASLGRALRRKVALDNENVGGAEVDGMVDVDDDDDAVGDDDDGDVEGAVEAEHSANSRSLVKMFRPLFRIMHADVDKARKKRCLYQVRGLRGLHCVLDGGELCQRVS